MKTGFTYILTNKNRSVLYIGVTANLTRRMHEHASGEGSVFCKRYNVNILIYYEVFDNIRNAIAREKQLKKWRREWKLELVEKRNPGMKNLMGDMEWFKDE